MELIIGFAERAIFFIVAHEFAVSAVRPFSAGNAERAALTDFGEKGDHERFSGCIFSIELYILFSMDYSASTAM
jgi:hypothetical protein